MYAVVGIENQSCYFGEKVSNLIIEFCLCMLVGCIPSHSHHTNKPRLTHVYKRPLK